MLTSRGFKDGDLALFQTAIQSLHKLLLDLVWRIGMVEIAHSGGHDVKVVSFGIVPGVGGFEGIKMEQRGGVHKAPVKKETIVCGSWGYCTTEKPTDVSREVFFAFAIAIVLDLSDMRLRGLIDLPINKRGCLTWRGWGRSKEEMFVYGYRKVGWSVYPLGALFPFRSPPLSPSPHSVRCAWSIAKIRSYTRSLLAALHIIGLPPSFPQ